MRCLPTLLTLLCLAIFSLAAIGAGPTPVGLSSMYLNIKDFGAKGDGKTDDTDALQQAINAAGMPDPKDNRRILPAVLLLPPGSYRVTKTLTIGKTQRISRIEGSGFLTVNLDAQTEILYDGPAGAPLFDIKPYEGLRMGELALNGNDKASVLLRFNSTPGNGTAQCYFERLMMRKADIGVEFGADMDMCASDMTFIDVFFENMKNCGVRTVKGQQVDYVFIRCGVALSPVGFDFSNGGVNMVMPTFYRVDTAIKLRDPGINAGVLTVSSIFLENFAFTNPKKRILILDAKGDGNVVFSSISTTCIGVWGDEADLETPNFLLGSDVQVSVRDSQISGRIAKLTSDPNGLPTWIQFDNCRFRCGSDPRKEILHDENSGFELRNCFVSLDDTRAKDYVISKQFMVPNFTVYPKNIGYLQEIK